jgi:hypothetical protein
MNRRTTIWRTNADSLSAAAEDFREVIRLEENLGSVYYIDSAKLGLAVVYFLCDDRERMNLLLATLPDDSGIYLAHRYWTPGMLGDDS